MQTKHLVVIGDCRNMAEIEDESIQLIITSPPYFNIKDYGVENIGSIDEYETYLKLMLMIILLAFSGMIFATMDINEQDAAKQLISSNESCDKLSQDQLELIGDYYMEQMHPGEAHERMDLMMGGEGSDNLRNAHIQMALVLYCGQTNTSITYGGMMGMMPFMYRSGFGGGMMGYPYGGMMGYDMMGYGGWGWIVALAFWVLVFAALVLLVFWLYKNISGRGTLSSLEILKQRYAKGEISKKEYEEMKKDLG